MELEHLEHVVGVLAHLVARDARRLEHGVPFRRQAAEAGLGREVDVDVVLHVERLADALERRGVLDGAHPVLHLGLAVGLDVVDLVNVRRADLECVGALDLLAGLLDRAVAQRDVVDRLRVLVDERARASEISAWLSREEHHRR